MTAAQDSSACREADLISSFFADLARPGHHEAFEGQSATLRIEVPGRESKTERWYLTIVSGHVSVTRQRGPADTVITLSRDAAGALLTGRLNAQAALLRGLVVIEGKIGPALMFQRCLPGPPGSTGSVPPISSQAVTAMHAGGENRGAIRPGQQQEGHAS